MEAATPTGTERLSRCSVPGYLPYAVTKPEDNTCTSLDVLHRSISLSFFSPAFPKSEEARAEMSPSIEEAEIYDVIIIGAGPCGLATAARLREHAPDALFTDEEHRRYSWIGKYGGNVSLQHVRGGKKTLAKATRRPEYKLAVLDATSDGWMGRWKELFAKFEIEHLRSHMLWHVDPLDRDALLAHAYRTRRQDELLEMRHCVGREISKHGKKKKAAGPRAYGGKYVCVSTRVLHWAMGSD
jgi:hypothetical protein